tara:strand:- start:274 stop:396 length:123 start_codon:yes stop_codon:yes gene_type:complete
MRIKITHSFSNVKEKKEEKKDSSDGIDNLFQQVQIIIELN